MAQICSVEKSRLFGGTNWFSGLIEALPSCGSDLRLVITDGFAVYVCVCVCVCVFPLQERCSMCVRAVWNQRGTARQSNDF